MEAGTGMRARSVVVRGMRGWIAAVVLAGVVAAAAAWFFAVGTASAANSPEGGGASFGASCDWSHQAEKDPITNPSGSSDPDPSHPGHSGAVHLHEFYGNESLDNFNYQDMVNASTTCNRKGSQKSAYWFPTVRWNGVQLQPKDAIIYYKHNNKNHKSVRPFPRNLKMIVDQEGGAIRWSCGNNEEEAQAVPPERCTNPKEPLTVKIRFPDCWDTRSLGTENNNWRGHMRFSRLGNDGNNHCSDGWRPMAQIQMRVGFRAPNEQGTFPDGPNGGAVTVSAGSNEWVPPGNGNMHADFWNTWEQGTLESLTKFCINQTPPGADRPARCQSAGKG